MLKALWREVSADGVSDLAASLAYRFLLALFPFFIFVASLSGYVARMLNIEDPATRLVDEGAAALPAEARTVLTEQLRAILEGQQAGLLSFGIVAALWAAGNGVAALMRAMNRVYDVEETRPFVKRTAIAIGLTLLGGVVVIGALALAVAGQALGAAAAQALGLGEAYATVASVLQYVLAVALLTVAAAFLFWAAPDAHLPFRWLSAGAALFVVGWIVATAAFGWYVSNFGNYNATYGALGGLIILMLWFYLTAFVMLIGAEVNVILARRSDDPATERELTPTDGTAAGRDEPEASRSSERTMASARDGGQVQRARESRAEGHAGRAGTLTKGLGLAVAIAAVLRAWPRRGAASR
ncbi:MAG: YihY/virulence factor BrkB family protein [Dehalococcoidia bacterium]